MKNVNYIIGLLSLIVLLTGIIFKVMHFPGAGIAFILGMGLMVFVFLPIAYRNLLKSTTDSLLKWVYHAAFISFFIDFVGVVFKVLHWPGAAKLMIIGIPLPFIFFLPLYINYHNKRKLKFDVSFFSICLFMIYLGVFSSLLAVNRSHNVINATISMAYTVSSTNSSYDASNNGLIELLDDMKVALCKAVDGNDEDINNLSKDFEYHKVISKDSYINQETFNESGLQTFKQAFELFASETQNNSELNKRLIHEINRYIIPRQNGQPPLITSYPLISVLNLITDWQNKILLMEYVQSTQS